MKFPTQHKRISISVAGKANKEVYTKHRDGSEIWLTRPEKVTEATVFSHNFQYVSEAKEWMNNFDVTIIRSDVVLV